MKTHLQQALVLGLVVGLCASCASTGDRKAAYNCLARSPVRVAILPSVNRTDQPGAQIVVDKAWEAALQKTGFEVVSADRVLTYVAARGMMLSELPARKPAELGKDLKVDLLLKSEILKWEISSKGAHASTTVEVTQRLLEAPTSALVWEHHWVFREEDSSEGLGKLFDKMLNTAGDKASAMGARGVKEISAMKIPLPGPPAKRK